VKVCLIYPTASAGLPGRTGATGNPDCQRQRQGGDVAAIYPDSQRQRMKVYPPLVVELTRAAMVAM